MPRRWSKPTFAATETGSRRQTGETPPLESKKELRLLRAQRLRLHARRRARRAPAATLRRDRVEPGARVGRPLLPPRRRAPGGRARLLGGRARRGARRVATLDSLSGRLLVP